MLKRLFKFVFGDVTANRSYGVRLATFVAQVVLLILIVVFGSMTAYIALTFFVVAFTLLMFVRFARLAITSESDESSHVEHTD